MITAVAVGTAIVVSTALLIWLIRPGKPGIPGGGGLLARQPRATILVLATAALVGGVLVFVRRRRHWARLSERSAMIIGSGVVIVLAIAGGIFWPGGVVRHWPKQSPIATTPATSPVSVQASTPTTATAPTTSANTGTTVKSPTTVAPPTTKGR